MKNTTIFLGILLLFACDKIGDAIESTNYEKPVINSLELVPESTVFNGGDTVTAIVSATNPEEGILTYSWDVSPNAGQFAGQTDKDTIRWIAPNIDRVFKLECTVSNDKSTSRDKSFTVISLAQPVVRILSPVEDDYFINGENIEIEVNASHNLGINNVNLYVNNELVEQLSGTGSDDFLLTFTPDLSHLGEVTIKVEAVANESATIGSAVVHINIEGVLVKRNGQ